ncbi:MAG: glycosyltransferase family 39 protein, partial [bacterium]|nr:glycosyltransferase family 39 protein [bacterium]
MANFSQNTKIFFRWWFAAFIIYLIVILLVGWHYGFAFFMPTGDDSAAFMQTAKNLLHYGVFSIDGVMQATEPQLPLHPTNFVTPGYVFWLALIYAIFKSFTPAIFLGALFFALSVPLTYFLSKEIIANKKIAFGAAAIFMIEPLSLYYAGLLFSEQIFVPVFLAACLLFVRYLNYGHKKELFISLFLFSFSMLIRPIIFYFLPFLILFVILKNFRISKKILLIYTLLSIFTVYSLVGAWLIRNKIVLDSWQISSNQGHTLGYHYDVLRQYLVKNRGFDPGQLNIAGPPLYGNQEYDTLMGKEATKMLWKYKWDYLKIHLGYAPLFFMSSGYDGLAGRLLDKPILNGTFRNNLALNLINGKIWEGLKVLANAPAAIYIFMAGTLMWVLVAIL